MEELIKKYDVDDDTKKKGYIEEEETKKKNDTRNKEKSGFNEHGININGLDKDGYNINGADEYGLNKDGFNINSIKGPRKKYPNRKVNWTYNDEFYYDQYGFDEKGLTKGGYDIYGFDEKGLNKDGLNKYGYKQSSGKGLNVSFLPIFLSKIYTNNSSKELINELKKLVTKINK